MALSKFKFSVIICTYNGQERVLEAIESIKKLDYPKRDYEIIVVDDNSSDKTRELVKKYKSVRLLKHDENLGVAAARNTGLQAAKGKWIAYLDDDCIAEPDWLTQLEKTLKIKGTLGAGGLIKPKDNSHVLQRYLFSSGYGQPASKESHAVRKSPIRRLVTYIKDSIKKPFGVKDNDEVGEVYGANSAFIKSKLIKIKGFDVSLRSSEDSDISTRLRDSDKKGSIRFSKNAVVRHSYHSSFLEYFLKNFRRQRDTYAYYQAQDKFPPIYPLPFICLIGVAISLFFGYVPFAICVILLPQILYFWWIISAIKQKRIEHLIYPYVQFADESVRLAGLFRSITSFKYLPSKPSARNKYVSGKLRLSKIGLFIYIVILWALSLALQLIDSPINSFVALPFLLIVPGMLLMTALGRSSKDTPKSLYAVVASIAILMLDGLVSNTITQITGNRIHLSTVSMGVVSSVTLILLMALAWRKTKKHIEVNLPNIRKCLLYALIVILMPVVSIMGAILLNNSGSNIVSIFMFIVLSIFALALLIWRDRLPNLLMPVAIFSIGLSIIFLGAFRGDSISGVDVIKEYGLFQLINHIGYWSPNILSDAYNACLSITLLPMSFEKLTGINGLATMRYLIPALYALVPVIIYKTWKNVLGEKKSLLCAIFFIAQPAFISWSSVPIRQMVAILFFVTALSVVLNKSLSNQVKIWLSVIFGSGMILSHYSTSYIALGLFGAVYLFQLTTHFVKKYRKTNTEFSPTIPTLALVLLVVVAAIWYGPVTHASGNITKKIENAWHYVEDGNINPFNSSYYANRTSLVDQVLFTDQSTKLQQNWNEYIVHVEDSTGLSTPSNNGGLEAQATQTMPLNSPKWLANIVNLSDQIVRKLVRLFLAAGLIIYVIVIIKSRKIEEHKIFVFASALILLAVIVIPRASIYYDVGRTSQQLIMLLAVPTIIGGLSLIKWLTPKNISERTRLTILGAVFALLMLFVSGVPSQITGGNYPTMALNNSGNQYDQWYSHDSEILSAQWLKGQNPEESNIRAGYFGGNKLQLAGMSKPTNSYILPWTINRDAYVYVSYGEYSSGLATTYYNGSYIRYKYPFDFLNNNKGLVYNNGQSVIYK